MSPRLPVEGAVTQFHVPTAFARPRFLVERELVERDVVVR
jgi:hypothetical protein